MSDFKDNIVYYESFPLFGIIASVVKLFHGLFYSFIIGGCRLSCCCSDDTGEPCMRCDNKGLLSCNYGFIIITDAIINILTLGFYQFFKQCNCRKPEKCCTTQCEGCGFTSCDCCCWHWKQHNEHRCHTECEGCCFTRCDCCCCHWKTKHSKPNIAHIQENLKLVQSLPPYNSRDNSLYLTIEKPSAPPILQMKEEV